MLDNGFIAQFGEVVGAPVPLQARHKQSVEHALYDRERRRPDVMEKWVTDRLHRLQGFFGFFGRGGATPNNPAYFLEMEMLREHGRGRDNQKCKIATDVLRCFLDEIAISAKNGCRFLKRPESRTELDGTDRVELEFEGSNHAEVPAPPRTDRDFLCCSR